VKYGPSRGELKFRLAASLGGLALMVVALVYRGVPTGPAFVEVVGIAGLFFGGTAIWSGWRLLKRGRED
jgi:xanthosine utilization system XapX-like protein